MTDRAAVLAEAYKRGLLPADQSSAYERAVQRGLVKDEFAAGKLQSKRGATGAATGGMATVNEAIPGADELTAGIDTVGRVFKGEKLGDAWKGARDRQAGLMTGFREDHPVMSALATGTGYAIQAVPALMSGGATLAPLAEGAAVKGLGALAGRALATGGKNAVVGATYAAGNAMTGRGSVKERMDAAYKAIPAGAAIGVAAPVVAKVASEGVKLAGRTAAQGGRVAIRAANNIADKTAGGAFLDPQEEVVSRLAEALQKDKLSPSQVEAALSEWQRVGGASPAFMDIVAKDGGGQNTMALVRGAAMSGSGRNVASQYGNRVAADLQDVAIDRTRALTSDTRTLPDIASDVEGRIATNSAAPDIQAGSGGAQVHQRLNQTYDQAKGVVDSAFNLARQASPEAAHIPAAELPQMAANVRDAVRDYHPDDVPGVTRILDGLDKLSTPTVRDLFEARSRLSTLRGGLDPIQGSAAAKATRALDDEIQSAVDRGVVAGDPTVVGLWRDAIGARRDFGRQFEGDDLIASLTERGMRGGGRTNVVAAEDASNAILGRNGVSQRPDLVRDLTRLRDTLGPNSAQWHSLRQEAASRLLGRDAGTENYGQAFDRFAQQSPELAALLVTPAERASLRSAQGNIAGAVADRTAVEAGRQVMSAPSDQFAVSMTGTGERRPLAQVGAAREIGSMIERPTEGATGILNRLSSSTRAKNNLAATFGDEPAADYQSSIGNAVEQVQNARHINPNTGAQTAGRLADETLVENIPTSKAGLVKAILDKFRSGATLTDAERGELVKLATGDAGTVAPKVLSRIKPAPVRMVGGPNLAPVLAGPMTRQDQR